jgi:zinc transport system substrate-binding protein
MIIRFLIMILLISPHASYAKIKVVTSITPLASLVAMIAGDRVEISNLASGDACPHHYSLKPSDIKNAQEAELFIYIDQRFDLFAKSLLTKSHAKILQVSEIVDLRIEKDNWHLWLLPENAMAILRVLVNYLNLIAPDDKIFFEHNLSRALTKLQELEELRLKVLSKGRFILLSHSADYLFFGADFSKLHQDDQYGSLRIIDELATMPKDRCFIISSGQSYDKYQNLLPKNSHIAQLETENWVISGSLVDLYYQRIQEMLKAIKGCNDTRR